MQTISQHIKSFVRHQGRFTPRQKHALQNLGSSYLLPSDNAFTQEKYFSQQSKLIVEIGFGMGQSLIEMACTQPENNFVGIEVYRPGVGSLIAHCEEQQLKNLKVYNHDAMLILPNCFQDSSIDKINVFFPDPWPKTRHHKRRLIQPTFVKLLTEKLKNGGILHLATDSDDYARHMLTVLTAETNLTQQSNTNFTERLDRPLSKYELRGQRLGHQIWDLLFVKTVQD